MMSLTWNWIAVALTLTSAAPGEGGPGAAKLKTAVVKLRSDSVPLPVGGRISYRIRVVEMEGLEWRRAGLAKFAEASHRGPVTVWTASNSDLRPILAGASNIVATPPQITAYANAAAHVTTRRNRSLITRVSWTDEEPQVFSESIREGLTATIAGRKLDQGVLIQLVLDDADVRSVHDVKLPDRGSDSSCRDLNPNSCENGGKPSEGGRCRDSEPDSTVQIPEVVTRELVGEWLIPNDGALVAGLGIHTASSRDGKAVVKERVVIIEATADPDVVRTGSLREPGIAPQAAPAPAPATIPGPVPPPPASTDRIPTPDVPSRTLPQGIHVDGTPAELPPLPEEATPVETDGSSEPRPSPQDRAKGQAAPSPAAPSAAPKDGETGKGGDGNRPVDSQAAKAGFTPGRSLVPARWSRVDAQTCPASLSRWIEAVRAQGAWTADGCSSKPAEPTCRQARPGQKGD